MSSVAKGAEQKGESAAAERKPLRADGVAIWNHITQKGGGVNSHRSNGILLDDMVQSESAINKVSATIGACQLGDRFHRSMCASFC